MDSLTDLLKKYIKIHNSDRNIENKKYFEKTRSIIINRTRYVPKNLDEIDNNIPFMYWIDDGMWKYIFNVNLERLYKEPLYYLENWLKCRIFYYENFNDCSYFDSFIPIWLGLGFETTFFGCRMKYNPDEEPVIDFQHLVLNNYEDLKKLKIPDFYNNDSMEIAFKFYDEIKNFVSEYGIEAGFFDWNLSPLNLCNYLRGLLNISLDFKLNKEFVRNLMDFLVACRIDWSKKRDEFLGVKRKNGGQLLNDPISVPNLSPDTYSELVFPYEKQIHDFYGSISYFHSCGPLEQFLNVMKDFKNMELLHSGPYTDYKKIFELFGSKSPIELFLPKRDRWEKEDLKNKLIEIKESSLKFGVKSFLVRYTSFYNPILGSPMIQWRIQHIFMRNI